MVDPTTLLRWLDRSIEPGTDREARQQARLVNGVSGMMMCFVPLFAALSFGPLDAPRTGLAVAVLGSGMALGPWTLRRWGATAAAHAVGGSLFLTILVVTLLNGGFTSNLPFAFAVVPALVAAAQGTRAGAAWVLTAAVATTALFVLHRVGVVLPAELHPGDREVFGLFVALCMPLIISAAMGLQQLTQSAYADDLADHQRTLRAVFEHTPEGLIITTDDGITTTSNRAARRLLGPATSGSHLAIADDMSQAWREVELRHPDGSRFRVAVTTVALDDRPGGKRLTVMHDLTVRRQAERAIANARDQALEAQRAKSTFLANMSHELRTPLNAVIGYGEMVADDLEARDDELLEDVHSILGAAKHLLQLVDDVLDLTRMEAGELVLSIEMVELEPLLGAVAGAAGPLFHTRTNTFEVDLASDLGSLRADPVRLRQALLHLLANAARFTSGGHVTLRGRRVGSSQVRLQVIDTGEGMSEAELKRVMQPFEQGDAASAKQAGGSGIGLPLVKHLVESLGAHLTLSSTTAGGTTATIDIPTEPVPARKARHSLTPSHPPS